jgi:hypothetical protein
LITGVAGSGGEIRLLLLLAMETLSPLLPEKVQQLLVLEVV